MSDQPDDALGVLRGIWAAQGQTSADLDDDCGTKSCKRMADINFDGLAGEDEDLRTACLEALKLRREDAAAHARKFSWRAATEQFLEHLHPRMRSADLPPPLANASRA